MPFIDPFQEVLTDAAAHARGYLRSIYEWHVGVQQEAVDDRDRIQSLS